MKKMNKTHNFNKKSVVEEAAARLESLLREAGFVRRVEIRKEMRKGMGPDFTAEVFTEERSFVLLVETRTSGEPRLAREAINALTASSAMWSHAYPVFAAPYISDKAAAIARENGAGYMDLAGNCRLSFDMVYIYTAGRNNPFRGKRQLKSFAHPKTMRILRVLLCHPHRTWKTGELAAEAGVSLGMVSTVAGRLKDMEIIENRKRGISLAQPKELLDRWVGGSSGEDGPAESVHRLSSFMDRVRAENALARFYEKSGVDFAFTGFSAAVHLASGTDYPEIHAYVSDDAAVPGKAEGFEKSSDNGNCAKGNIVLVKAQDKGVFYGKRRVMPSSRLQYCNPAEKTVEVVEEEIRMPMYIVSPVQVYRDLHVLFGATAAAGKLLRQAIEPSW